MGINCRVWGLGFKGYFLSGFALSMRKIVIVAPALEAALNPSCYD